MPRYQILAIDIDGTLVNSQHELTHVTRDAIRRAKQGGIEVVLATGRRYRHALPLVEPLGVKVPLVTASGALIKDPPEHRTLFRADFAEGALGRWLAFAEQSGYQAVLYTDSYGQGFDYYCADCNPSQLPELAEFLTLNTGCEHLWPTLMAQPPEGVFAGFVMGTRSAMLDLAARLDEHLPGQLYTHVLRSPRYRGFMCEILPHGVSKWSGICHLAEQWGIGPEAICAVGDDVNDIPMITAAGLGIAMGNAVAEVKSAADWIAPTHDEDGLVAVVERLLEE